MLKTIRLSKREDINPIKVLLVEKMKTGKWLAEQLGKDPSMLSKWCSNASQSDLGTLPRLQSYWMWTEEN